LPGRAQGPGKKKKDINPKREKVFKVAAGPWEKKRPPSKGKNAPGKKEGSFPEGGAGKRG